LPVLLAGQAENVVRVLRGGAFNNNDRNVRCAIRNNNHPNNRNNNIGFRVVVASHASPFESNQAVLPGAQVGNTVHLRMAAETEIEEEK
jgi:hypothetical protein